MPRGSLRRRRVDIYHHNIPTKANRILHIILIAMLLILMRVWHLSVVQYDKRLEDSQKPKRKTVIEPAIRATIRDRYNIPLAMNRISYQATLLYSQIRDIPSVAWEKDATGTKIKVYKRKRYIEDLSRMIAQELGVDADRIEDLIHSKASYYAQVPFVLKDELTEKEYYRLKVLEKDWPGLHTRHLPKRYYPKRRLAGDVIGYMGAINRQEYEKILHEMKALNLYISSVENGEEVEAPPGIETPQKARRRLWDLEAKAYTIHDYVGKTGIEGIYEEQLRGYYGKKKYYADPKGNFLRELPGSRPPLSGERVLLTLSAELQEYAEQLLAQNEEVRVSRKSKLGAVKKTVIAQKEPWIKGGSIVVMDPLTAEVLALASYPRFDPNDFIQSGNPEEQKKKSEQIYRWFEHESHIAQLWNQQKPFQRERYDAVKQQFYDVERWLTWKNYLDFILPADGALRHSIDQVKTIRHAIDILEQIENLRVVFANESLYVIMNALYQSEDDKPFGKTLDEVDQDRIAVLLEENRALIDPIKASLHDYFSTLPQNYDKVLLVDLCRLALDENRFSADILQYKGEESLADYHDQKGCLVVLFESVKDKAKDLYHHISFKEWRSLEEKDFLKAKRAEEKARKTYQKPYIDYLDKQENIFFKEFWEVHRWDFLLALLTGISPDEESELKPYFEAFQQWHDQIESGNDDVLSSKREYVNLQKAISGMPFPLAIDFLKTMRSFDELNRPLFGRYRYLRRGTPPLERHLAAAFYPAYGYGYGRSYAYRQASIQGSLFKLVTAYEALVQKYKRIGKDYPSQQELNPFVMVDEAFNKGKTRYVGYTDQGEPIPQLYKGGRLPRSLAHLHIGKVDLVKALEVSSNPYFSLLAGECLDDPEDLSHAARQFSLGSKTGIELPYEIAGKVPTDLSSNRTGLYAMAIGQHSLVVTPLQTAVMLAAIANGGKVVKPRIVKLTAGSQPRRGSDSIQCMPSFPYQEQLSLIGIDFPLFTSTLYSEEKSLIKQTSIEIKRELFMPHAVRSMLLSGLQAASLRTQKESISSLTRLYRQYPEAVRHFADLKDQLLGKTSTSESVENLDLDLEEGTNIYTHVWFGSIVFEKKEQDKNKAVLFVNDQFGEPELIVVVYLRYGGYGKEAAPLAAQVVKKWRELKDKHGEK